MPFVRRFFAVWVVFVFISAFTSGQDLAPQPFPFHWKAVKGAGGYLAEIEDISGQPVATRTVDPDQTSVDFALVPGPYQLRLTTLNRFQKAESDTGWVHFQVAATSPPSVGTAVPVVLEPGKPGTLTMEISGLAQDATVSLVSPTTRLVPATMIGPVGGQLTVAIPPLDERGDWQILLTNPPKLSASLAGKLAIHYAVPVVTPVAGGDQEASDETETIRFSGGEFSKEAVANLVSGDSSVPLAVVNRSPKELTVLLPAALAPGKYQFEVANAADESFVGAGALTLTAHGPVVSGFTPATADAEQPFSFSLSGRHLHSDDRAELISSATGLSVPAQWTADSSQTSATATFPALAPGDYRLKITAADGKAAMVLALTLVLPVPTVGALTLIPGTPEDATQNLSVTGTRWTAGTKAFLELDGNRHEITIVTHEASRLTLSYSSDLPGGTYDLILANRDGKEASLAAAVKIVEVPEWAKTLSARAVVSTATPTTTGVLSHPEALARTPRGLMYVVDSLDHSIKKVNDDGVIRFVGTGRPGASNGGFGGAVSFKNPTGLAVDDDGNLYVADSGNNLLRKITPKGVASTLAQFAPNNGRTVSTQGVAVAGDGTVFVSDPALNQILRVTGAGKVSLLSGVKEGGSLNGPVKMASFLQPQGLAVDPAGVLYVADTGNNCIRRITPDGRVSTLAGTGVPGDRDGSATEAQFDRPYGLAVDHDGNLFVTETVGNKIRRVAPDGSVVTVAGTGETGTADGRGNRASFDGPRGILVAEDGSLYVADSLNARIRKVVLPTRKD